MKYFSTILFSLLSFFAVSQGPVTIVGKIVSSKSRNAIPYANVKLLDCNDSTTILGVKSDSLGFFKISERKEGCLILQVNSFSFVSYYKQLNLDAPLIDLGSIELYENQELNQINLIQDIEVLKTGFDKKVYNVSQDLTVQGGTANDILNRLPSIEVDQEGNIMLRGEGRVIILIDGKQSSISGGNGETLLDALPAGSIDKIEIVTNPSAKYDPDGTSGIINIVLKKNKLKGINLFINSNTGSGNLRGGNLSNSNIGLSFRNKKINVFGNYSLNYYEGYRNNYSQTNQLNNDGTMFSIIQNRTGTDFNASHSYSTGVDWYINQENEIGISFSGLSRTRNRTGDLWNSLYDSMNNRTDLWERISYDPSKRLSIDGDLTYKRSFLEKRADFSFNMHQSIGTNEIQGLYIENYYSPDSIQSIMSPLEQQLFNQQQNNIFSSQADLKMVFPKYMSRMEAGVKMIHQNQLVDTYSEQYDTLLSEYVEDSLANFEYAYNERVYSIYALYGQQKGKFKYQAGLRGEMAYQIPNLISEGVLIDNDPYLNLFPSAHLRYMMNDLVEMSISYSKRINRPNSRNLNPFTNYSDPFNLRRGNPYLKPEYVDSYDLSIVKEGKKLTISGSTYYRYSTGVISRVKEYYENNTSAATYMNISKTHGIGSELFANFRFFKWLKTSASWNGNYIWYITDSDNAVDRSGFYHNFKFNSTWEFWNKMASVQLSYVYNGKRVTLQGVAQRTGPTDIAFEKKIKDSNWSFGCRVSDIFNVQGFYLNINQPDVSQISTYKWLTRRYIFSFNYKFGKLDNKMKSSVPPNSGE